MNLVSTMPAAAPTPQAAGAIPALNSPALIYALRWLVRDTFRQAIAGKVFWILIAVSALAILFCLGITIEGGIDREHDFLYSRKTGEDLTGPNPAPGTLTLLYGAITVEIGRGEAEEVHFIQVLLATWVAGTVGLLLTLVWTAGFLPEALQPASASVLLSKPMPRSVLLLGKYLGVMLFVLLQTTVFFAGTWLALGLRTNVWTAGYLAGIPFLTLQFAGIFAFGVFLATATRSTVACVLGMLLFWGACVALNYGRHSAMALPVLAPGTQMPALSLFVINVGYWLLPKPADMLLLLEQSLGASGVKTTLSGMPEFVAVQQMGAFDPLLAIASIGVFVVATLALAAYQLARTDY